MKKLTELSRKSYLEAWNPSIFIKFVIINTSDGFFLIQNLIKYLSFEAKLITIFRLFDQSDDDIMTNDNQLKSKCSALTQKGSA